MNKTFSSSNVLWVIGFIISLLCVLGLLFLMLQERAKRIETERALAVAKDAKEALQLKLGQAQLELIQLKDQARLLAKQVEEEKRTRQKAQEELSQRNSEISALESDLQIERKKSSSLDESLSQFKRDYNELEKKLKTAETMSAELKGQLVKSKDKEGVNLKTIVVKPQQEKLSGRVLVVNREFQFLVIDLGRKDGLNVGDELTVYQAREEVGRVQVEKLYDTMSIATILPGAQGYKIREDNIVKSF